MASIYKRATREQQQMLKIVAGAVRNTMHAHGMPVDYRFARSVAKRAVGTLSAECSELGSRPQLGTRGELATSTEDGQQG